MGGQKRSLRELEILARSEDKLDLVWVNNMKFFMQWSEFLFFLHHVPRFGNRRRLD